MVIKFKQKKKSQFIAAYTAPANEIYFFPAVKS